MIGIKRAFLSISTVLFAVLVILSFQDGKRQVGNNLVYLIIIATIWIFFLITAIISKRKNVRDITSGVFVIFILWEIFTRILDILPPVLFPTPEGVFQVFYNDRILMLQGLISSLFILVVGLVLATIIGNILGLFVGWNKRLREDFYPVAKVISPIPPMIYTPYLIAVLPTFTLASIAVIAFGLFWPNFMFMIEMVVSIDKRIIDTAKAMNVSTRTMILRVILPYSLPSIIGGLRIQLSTTFMILIMAEMIGAQSGLGFFIKKYSDYADYTRVVAGIIFIGVVITVLNKLLAKFESCIIKWKRA